MYKILKMINCISSKLKLLLFKVLLRKWKDKPPPGRKYFQNMYLMKDLYPEHIKNSHNSIMRPKKLKIGTVFEQVLQQKRYVDGK